MQVWRGWETNKEFIVRSTPRNSQCHSCQTWTALGPLAPAMLSLQLMAGAQHGMGLGLQVTETGPGIRQLLQNKRALCFFVQVWVLSMSWGWSSAKSLCQGAPKLGCSFLQPGMAWQAWRAGVAGLRKDFISTGRSIKQKELGAKWTEWVIDVQRGLAFQGGKWEFPDRDIMPAWQGQATDVTHSSSAPFRTPDCSTFYLTHLAGFGMCSCQS